MNDETGVPSGLTTLAQAFGTGLALAAGVAMGTYFASLLQAKRTGEPPRPAAAASPTTVARANPEPTLSDTGDLPRPNFEDGVRNQLVLDAIERSSESRRWEEVGNAP